MVRILLSRACEFLLAILFRRSCFCRVFRFENNYCNSCWLGLRAIIAAMDDSRSLVLLVSARGVGGLLLVSPSHLELQVNILD